MRSRSGCAGSSSRSTYSRFERRSPASRFTGSSPRVAKRPSLKATFTHSTCSAWCPFGKVRYDNLKAAVSRVLGFSRYRQESERWCAFRSHVGLEAFYCQPGIDGAHETCNFHGSPEYFTDLLHRLGKGFVHVLHGKAERDA